MNGRGSGAWSRFLIAERRTIDRVLAANLGPAAPDPAAPESEVLRRFRSFASAALRRGDEAKPALDGLRTNERRVAALLSGWAQAASQVAGHEGPALRQTLDPLIQRFRNDLARTGTRRRASGAPRAKRRAVVAAIDRIADAFLALDAETAAIVDANPAAGALLGVARDALFGVDALSFVAPGQQDGWWTELGAMTEGAEPRRFVSCLRDASGREIAVDCQVTRFTSRGRTLALVVARPG